MGKRRDVKGFLRKLVLTGVASAALFGASCQQVSRPNAVSCDTRGECGDSVEFERAKEYLQRIEALPAEPRGTLAPTTQPTGEWRSPSREGFADPDASLIQNDAAVWNH